MRLSTSALVTVIFPIIIAAAPTITTTNTTNTTTKLTVYWGAEDDNLPLIQVCTDPAYNIVNLAFLTSFHHPSGYPILALSGLSAPSAAQSAVGATGLLDGTSLVPAIETCQQSGKLVLLSMGGAVEFSDVRLRSDEEGVAVADMIWDLFLGGTGREELRPFGGVKLDGVDLGEGDICAHTKYKRANTVLDNETKDTTGYLAMVRRFRANMVEDASKRYYMSAAPQCPFPDASEPLDVCRLMDFVWVQFYNNGDCNIAEPGFETAVRNWSEGIGDGTELFIGGLASAADGDEGYVDAAKFVEAVRGVEGLRLGNYGGVMLWEAQLSRDNDDYHRKIRGGLQASTHRPYHKNKRRPRIVDETGDL